MKILPSATVVVRKIGPHEGFQTHKYINTGKTKMSNKTFGESEMRIRRKQRIVTPDDLAVSNNTTEMPEQKKS